MVNQMCLTHCLVVSLLVSCDMGHYTSQDTSDLNEDYIFCLTLKDYIYIKITVKKASQAGAGAWFSIHRIGGQDS